MKRLVVFSDGTWASPLKSETTNVLRMARGVSEIRDSIEQIAFYDWGVGTDRKVIAGGAMGAGIDKNIMDCYRFIAHNYQKGDELYFFGFSRGAYTVRSLAGFIRNAGILRRQHEDRTLEAYELYRKRTKKSSPSAPEAKKFRQRFAVSDKSEIRFVGVWDTVGALGIPTSFLGTLTERDYLFHDTEPSGIIKCARHALSIDENRFDFLPTLWDEKKAKAKSLDLKQVWFAGVHSDVGGGYKETGLSNCALYWMLREAHKAGLQFESHFLGTIAEDPHDKMHNEYRGFYRILGAARLECRVDRDIGPSIHASVKERWDQDTDGYQKKSKALQKLLNQSGGWNDLEIANT